MKKIDSLLVKGFAGYRITKTLPWHSVVGLTIFVIVLLISHWLIYWIGINNGAPTLDETKKELLISRENYTVLENELKETYKKNSNLIENESILTIHNEKLTGLVEKLQSDIIDLTPELTYLRSITSTEGTTVGLNIQGAKLIQTQDEYNNTVYDYQFIIRMIGSKSNYTKGTVKLEVIGLQDSNPKILQVASNAFKFKYFQKETGNILLPLGFSPSILKIILVSKNPNIKSRSTNFVWDSLFTKI